MSTPDRGRPCPETAAACYKSESVGAFERGAGKVMRARFMDKNDQGVRTVGLKAPSIITFMLSVILAVIVLMSTFFGAEIPGLKGNELWALLASYAVLMLGCMVPGL
jgi:hypothetical protein